jgi:hypothetical protein
MPLRRLRCRLPQEAFGPGGIPQHILARLLSSSRESVASLYAGETG